MSSVLIMMSTYNGGENIIRQVESIINQEKVDVSLLIRDDGSDDNTLKVLKKIEKDFDNVNVVYGKNIGWKKSFLDLVYQASLNYDYYGFSDQDDIWFSDKVSALINAMETDPTSMPKLAHCNSLSVDGELKKRNEQETRTACPPNFKAAIATEYFQGCGMLWNKQAMELVRLYRPENEDLAHDYWIGLVCYLFGKVYFCEEPKFYHIRYEDNSSEDGNVWKGRLKRLKKFISKSKVYMNPSEDLYKGYYSLLNREQLSFIKEVILYRVSLLNKIKLIVDRSFIRPSTIATLLFKTSILLNKF